MNVDTSLFFTIPFDGQGPHDCLLQLHEGLSETTRST